MRRFVRHPVEFPIMVNAAVESDADFHHYQTTTLSEGGLSCEVERDFAIGSRVEIRIPSIIPEYQGYAMVVWCQVKAAEPDTWQEQADSQASSSQSHHARPCFQMGLQFLDADEAYKARMVQQVCQIERYRRNVLVREGRNLDNNAAAKEWIAKFAASFK